MPAPPRKGESKEAFLSRCFAHFANKEKGTSKEKSAAICYSMWERKNKGKK